jgi:hypothetical protein
MPISSAACARSNAAASDRRAEAFATAHAVPVAALAKALDLESLQPLWPDVDLLAWRVQARGSGLWLIALTDKRLQDIGCAALRPSAIAAPLACCAASASCRVMRPMVGVGVFGSAACRRW